LRDSRIVLALLGGTSVGTPWLIKVLAAARQAGHLPDLELRLFGRAMRRAERLTDYAEAAIEGTGRSATAPIRLRSTDNLDDALSGSDLILCQIRPGGFDARGEDERMPLEEGVPGDEGLGPSGLASFLRSRPLLQQIAEAWDRQAPGALFLQLTSPLGLLVAGLAQSARGRVVGLCELPATTSALIKDHVEPKLGYGPLRHAHLGLNHWAWLYAFTDAAGIDRTAEVLAATDSARLLRIDADVLRREAAIPLHYLRLIYHAERALAEQRARSGTRSEEVAAWAASLDAIYDAGGPIDATRVTDLLQQRRMNWYDEAVLPALTAFCGSTPKELVLNLTGLEPGGVAIELPCRITGRLIEPLPQPPLPPGPAALFRRLTAYERAALALPRDLTCAAIAEVLALHPMVPDERSAVGLAQRIAARLQPGPASRLPLGGRLVSSIMGSVP
jgi:6-phospho-beta-glucosidase